ncbi:hypothetical protein V6L77_22075 [Pannonibacter sp. Pt2-lr]
MAAGNHEPGNRAARNWPLLLQVQPGDELDNALEDALAYQVDGAIVAAGSVSPALAERCRNSGAPIVMVGRIMPGGDTDAVCCDNRLGLELLVDHLASSGRKSSHGSAARRKPSPISSGTTA